MTTPEVSHGRGGAGNINPDDTQYVDGEIVRAGIEGSHGDGAYSSGRGGAANIGDRGSRSISRKDADLIPQMATRASQDADYHVGRGGAGNEHVAEGHKGHQLGDTPVGLADKLKHRVFGVFKK